MSLPSTRRLRRFRQLVFHTSLLVLAGTAAIHWFKLADLDGDRDLDAFVFHQIHTGNYYSAVWLNE